MSASEAHAAHAAPAEERRSAPRLRTFKSGKIVFNNDFSVFDCVVRNMTEHGACLEFGSVVGVPASFELRLADGTRHICHLVWRFDNRMGVSFE